MVLISYLLPLWHLRPDLFLSIFHPRKVFLRFRMNVRRRQEFRQGILPAADGPGIQYVLSVDSVGPNGESGYTLVTTYLDAEGQGKNTSFTSKGKRQVIQKDVNNNKKTAYKLTPDNGDSPVYFVVVNDTTLRLVNDSLQEAVSDLNYDIVQVK